MYVIYVVGIGGGYMPGRFLTAPFFASLCALMLTIPHLSKRIFVVTLATILVCNLCSPTSTLRGKFIENRGNFHVAANSLVSLIQDKEEPVSNHIWAHRGRQLHKFSKHQSISSGEQIHVTIREKNYTFFEIDVWTDSFGSNSISTYP